MVSALIMQQAAVALARVITTKQFDKRKFWKTKEDVEAVQWFYSTFSTMDNLMFIHGEARATWLRMTSILMKTSEI